MSTRSSAACSAAPETSARAELRSATAAAHEQVDAAYRRFDLADRHSYGRFLQAHGTAFLGVEAGLDRYGVASLVPDWAARRRGALLSADLTALGCAVPLAETVAIESDAAALGALYVLEGSRLGGALLARQVAPELPRSYLGTPQAPGAWRKLLETIERELYRKSDRSLAIAAALDVFAWFEAAALGTRNGLPLGR